MQKNDVKKKDLPLDTTLRTYSVRKFDYKIQPQDVLFVRFESLSGEEIDFLSRRAAQGMGANPAFASLFGEMVDESGEIEYQVLGKIKVAGLNVFEIQEKLRVLADDYVESPKVSVRLLNFRATILGEVVKEGQVAIPNNRVSLLEVIGLAGGMSEFADKSKVKLIRQVDGQVDIQYLNLLDENFINSPYYYVHQNDVLVVPPLNQRPFRRYFGPNLALVVSTLSLALLTLNLLK